MSETAATAPPAAAPVRRVLVFTIVAFALMMMSIDSTIVATALPTLERDLDAPINWAGWTITAYSFGFVTMLPLSGKLCERHGRRRVFLASVAVFSAASLLCGLADDIRVLIALRVLQAAGGAGFTPSATGIIVEHFGAERDRAVSLFGSIFPAGAMIGPIFGGMFVTWWSWRGIFWINVPIGALVLALTLRYVPRDRPGPAQARRGADLTGMALLGAGLFAAMLGATLLGEWHLYASPLVAALPLTAALAALWGFFRHVRRAPDPFIAPQLIHGPGFGTVNLINGLFSGIPFGVVALMPLYAANRYGIGALQAGTLLVAQGAAAIVFSAAAALVLRRTGYRAPLYLGVLVAAAGIGLLALGSPDGIDPWRWLAGSAFLVGTGNGVLNPASRNAGLQLAPEHASTLAALRSMCMQIGSIFTISVATAILAGAGAPGTAQAWFYAGAALVLLAALPLIARVPEHRGAW